MALNINSLIKEELADMVREAAPQAPGATLVKDDRLKFVQIVDADYYNFEPFTADFDTGIDRSKITIHWGVSFMVNAQGIYKFNIDIENVEGNYLLNMYDKHTDELMQSATKNINDTKWQFKVDDTTLEMGGFLFVKRLDFDFRNNVCLVMF